MISVYMSHDPSFYQLEVAQARAFGISNDSLCLHVAYPISDPSLRSEILH